jgi:hypothetical protein
MHITHTIMMRSYSVARGYDGGMIDGIKKKLVIIDQPAKGSALANLYRSDKTRHGPVQLEESWEYSVAYAAPIRANPAELCGVRDILATCENILPFPEEKRNIVLYCS